MDYMIGDALIEEFRDGIFELRTRRFGTVAEIMVKRLYDLDESGSLAFDKRDRHSKERIEVKFSTVMKENDDRIRDDNVIDQCKKANLANRAMKSSETNRYSFDCNIQQVKRKEFDLLYYGLLPYMCQQWKCMMIDKTRYGKMPIWSGARDVYCLCLCA